MHIRTAHPDDLPALLDIYNYEVLNGVATFDCLPHSLAQRQKWFEEHNIGNHPLIVAITDDGTVAGYASLSDYRPKDSYRTTVELSVYVAHTHRRRGIATRLMEAILCMAREDESIHTVVSVITSENEASLALHKRFGFTYCGTLKEVGKKFGRMLSIDNYQLMV